MATRPAAAPTARNAGFGCCARRGLCSTTSPPTVAWRCWCSCWGRHSPASSCSDRCPTYLSYHRGLAQFCWAHLQRTLKGIGEFASTPDAVHFARDMLSAVGKLFALWYRFRGEAGVGEHLLSRTELIQQSIP